MGGVKEKIIELFANKDGSFFTSTLGRFGNGRMDEGIKRMLNAVAKEAENKGTLKGAVFIGAVWLLSGISKRLSSIENQRDEPPNKPRNEEKENS